jgi:hypothetical protein
MKTLQIETIKEKENGGSRKGRNREKMGERKWRERKGRKWE